MFFGTAIMATFYKEKGLSPPDIFWLQTALNLSLVMADIPFGYLADRFGLRRIIFAGTGLQIAQSSYFMTCSSFWEFLPALVGSGLYAAALSNVHSSLMATSLAYIKDAEERKARYTSYEMQAFLAHSAGVIVGIAIGGWLIDAYGHAMPYQMQPLVYITSFVIALGFKKPRYRAERHPDLGTIRKITHQMLKEDRGIRSAILLFSAVASCVFAGFWMAQPRMELGGIHANDFVFVYLIREGALFVLMLVLKIQLKKDLVLSDRLWPWSIAGVTLMTVLVGLTSDPITIVILMVGNACTSAVLTVKLRSFMNERLPQDYSSRTAELSVMTSVTSLCYAVVGPISGYIAAASVGAAFVVVAVVSGGFGYILLRAYRKYAQ